MEATSQHGQMLNFFSDFYIKIIQHMYLCEK